MHGMLDHHARVAFAREHADTLREVMRASRRQPVTDDVAGRREPVRHDVAAPTRSGARATRAI
jgi:hypothetical protein